MTLVKFNGRPVKAFNLMEEFVNGIPSSLRNEQGSLNLTSVPVNITETNEAFELEVIAPGFDKADFKINVDKEILTVSTEKETEVKKEDHKKILSEYNYRSFKRSFTLNEKIDAENIEAKYVNGVLTLNLPKRPEVKASAKEISVK
jgi:HSP20 family protein